jgi:hypothetical protein
MDAAQLKTKNLQHYRPLNKLSKKLTYYVATTKQAKRVFSRKLRSQPNLLWATPEDQARNKGITSMDPGYIKTKADAQRLFSQQWKVETDDDGFVIGAPVTSNFSSMLSASGMAMNPTNVPPSSNEVMLAQAGVLTTGFTSYRHERIAKSMFKCMFGKHKTASLSIAKASSTCFPDWQAGEGSYQYKISLIHYILDHLEYVLDLIDKDDWHTLRVVFRMVMCYNIGFRAQADEAELDSNGNVIGPKKRKVLDLMGVERVADKEHFTRTPNTFGMRMRTVYGMCGAINYLLSAFMVGRREHYFSEYGATWHHTGPQQIYDAIVNCRGIVNLDVTQMDQRVPAWFLDYYCDQLEQVFDKRLVKLVRYLNRAPYYGGGLADGMDNFFMGDPADPSTWNIEVGLASGRADNPDLGKYWMSMVYTCVLDELSPILDDTEANDFANMSKFLKHQHDIWRLLDMGDDAVAGVIEEEDTIKTNLFTLLQSGTASPYAVLDVAWGDSFVGSVMMRDKVGVIQLPKPNIVTFNKNRWCPERSINDKFRPQWGAGFFASLEHYRAAGSYADESLQTFCDIWSTHIDYPNPIQCAAMHMKANPSPFRVSTLSPADLEVLDDPAKRFYKFRDDELSDEVKNLFSWSVPGDHVDRSIKNYSFQM